MAVDSSEESTGCSASEQAATQAVVNCLGALKQNEAPRNRGSCEKETWEDAIDDALEQLSHLQFNKVYQFIPPIHCLCYYVNDFCLIWCFTFSNQATQQGTRDVQSSKCHHEPSD